MVRYETTLRAKCGSAFSDYDQTFRTALNFLRNPYELRGSYDLIYKRTALKLVFSDNLPYVLNEGFRTVN